MTAWRQVIELSIGEDDLAKLVSITRSRTEPASRVERARMLLAYRQDPSFFAVGHCLGVHHQTVQRCVERALAYGPMAALDDRPRPGKEPTITAEAKAWLVSLACRKAKELGYPHELWTTRLLARHAREHGPAEGHACLGKLVQGTMCKILTSKRSSRTRCAPTWNAGTPSSKRRWRKFCASSGIQRRAMGSLGRQGCVSSTFSAVEPANLSWLTLPSVGRVEHARHSQPNGRGPHWRTWRSIKSRAHSSMKSRDACGATTIAVRP